MPVIFVHYKPIGRDHKPGQIDAAVKFSRRVRKWIYNF